MVLAILLAMVGWLVGLFLCLFLLWLNSLSFYLKSNCWTHPTTSQSTEKVEEKDVSIKMLHELVDLVSNALGNI